jgi:hypothetical protein
MLRGCMLQSELPHFCAEYCIILRPSIIQKSIDIELEAKSDSLENFVAVAAQPFATY